MHVEEIRDFVLSFKDVEECFPFGEETLVFKTRGKIFLLLSLSTFPPQFNVKCDPARAIELREKFPAVIPGYHMNKKHWNTIVLDGTINDDFLKEFITHSYSLVNKIKLR